MKNDKFVYLEGLIKKLAKDDEFVVAAFLLKSQYVEYGLKYLLAWHPYKPANYYSDSFLDKATMGMVIKKLEDLDDTFLSDIVPESKEFLNLRNELTHNLLISKKAIVDIENECREKMELADTLQQRIHFLIDFVDDMVYGRMY